MSLPQIGCEMCDHKGYSLVDGEIVSCECMIRKRLYYLYESIGIPRNLYNAKIEQFHINNDGQKTGSTDIPKNHSKQKERIRNRIISYMQQMDAVFHQDVEFVYGGGVTGDQLWTGRTISLCGKRGSGKSLLVACIAKRAMELGLSPKIIQWADVIEACYDFDEDSDSYDDVKEILQNAKPIIIENFSMNYETRKHPTESRGTGGLNPVTRRRIDSLFSVVQQKGLVTVITTSHDASELNGQDAYGPLMSSILLDSYKMRLPSVEISPNYNVMEEE